jgi:hypothetical protein
LHGHGDWAINALPSAFAKWVEMTKLIHYPRSNTIELHIINQAARQVFETEEKGEAEKMTRKITED